MADRPEATQDDIANERRLRPFLLERYADFLALERGSAKPTREAYARDVARFTDFVLLRKCASPVDITPRVLREFVYQLKDLGLSPASIRRNVSAVRSYFKFLMGDGHLLRDPSERL